MNITLSRRVAKVMKSKTVLDLSFADRAGLAFSAEKATTFNTLPDKYKKIIKSAESEKTKKKA